MPQFDAFWQSGSGDNIPVRIDLYTKAVLTIIAVMVTVIAANQLFNPRVANAQGSFSGVQYTYQGMSFFAPRTGEIWNYNNDGKGWTLFEKLRLTKLGQALAKEK